MAIFVDTKYASQEATAALRPGEAQRKWAQCLAWREESEAARIMGIGQEDCFLVVASWHSGEHLAIQAMKAMDKDSHVLILGREELTRFYTPTLVSRPHLIAGRDLVGVAGAAAGGDDLDPQAEV